MPLRASSLCRALRSAELPSPGAPVTFGTRAESDPGLSMLPVTVLRADDAGAPTLAACGGAGCEREAVCSEAEPVSELEATAGAPCPGSHAVIDVTVLAAIAEMTCGVTDAHGSLLLPVAANSSPLTRCTPLPLPSVTSQM